MRFDIVFDFAPLDDVFTIPAQKVVDGFDANADGAGRLVLVEILEREIRCAGSFDDAFDHPIDGGIMAAFETGDLKSDEVGVSGCELRSPHFVVGACGVAILPDVADVERMGDQAGANHASVRQPRNASSILTKSPLSTKKESRSS